MLCVAASFFRGLACDPYLLRYPLTFRLCGCLGTGICFGKLPLMFSLTRGGNTLCLKALSRSRLFCGFLTFTLTSFGCFLLCLLLGKAALLGFFGLLALKLNTLGLSALCLFFSLAFSLEGSESHDFSSLILAFLGDVVGAAQ